MGRRSWGVVVAAVLCAACSGGDGAGGATTSTVSETTTSTVAGAESPRTSVVDGEGGGEEGNVGIDGVELSLRQLSSQSAQVGITGTVTNPAGGAPVSVAGVRTSCGGQLLDLLSVGGESLGELAPGAEGALDLRAIVHADEAGCDSGDRTLELRLAVAGGLGAEVVLDLGPLPSLDDVIGPLDGSVLSPDGLCGSFDRAALEAHLAAPIGATEVERLTCFLLAGGETGARYVLVEAYVDAGPVTPLHPAPFGCVEGFLPSTSTPEVLTCRRDDRSVVAVIVEPDLVLAVSSQRAVSVEATVSLLGVVRSSLDPLRA